jgi:hypothetical protein
MSGRGFQALYYTDCRPGQGLRGGAGFQFQAVTPGVGHDLMTLVQRSTLYEPPLEWMRQHRPTSSYPPSLTHVFDGVYVTARGIYLGTEAGGVREGNQFTHAIATEDPDCYGLTRPAQFWEAPWWQAQPAEGTELAPLAPEPEPGPLGVDAVREWLLGRPEAESVLTALCSALDSVHEPDGRRIVFISESAEDVLRWIAAGTLLLPQDRALRIGFRVFATNPDYSGHEVLALHPDWAGSFSLPAVDFAVFDLVTGRHPEQAPTDAANYWVPRFLRADPYDVVDAVELADQFARHRSAEAHHTNADRVVSSVVTLNEPVGPHARVVVDWLVNESRESTSDVLGILVDALLVPPADSGVLRRLIRAVHDGPAELAARVRYALLRAEVDDIVRGRGTDFLSDHGALDLTVAAPHETAATELVEGAAQHVPPQRMDPLLRLATAFGVTPDVHRFAASAHRFAAWWADHPNSGVDPFRWSCRPAMIGLLREQLAARLDGPAASRTVAAIRGQWWRALLPTMTDPHTPLDAVVSAAAIEQSTPDQRRDAVRAVLRRLPDQNQPDAVWAALFRFSPPTMAELRLYLQTVQAPSQAVLREAAGVLDRSMADMDDLDGDALDMLGILARHGHPPRQPLLRTMIQYDETLQRWLSEFRRSQQGPKSPSTALLRTIPQMVFVARASEMLRVLLGEDLRVAVAITAHGGDQLRKMLVRELPRLWTGANTKHVRRHAAVALAFATARSTTCPQAQREQFETALWRWAVNSDQTDRTMVATALQPLGDEEQQDWRDFLNVVLLNRKPRPNAQERRSKQLRWPFGPGRERG